MKFHSSHWLCCSCELWSRGCMKHGQSIHDVPSWLLKWCLASIWLCCLLAENLVGGMDKQQPPRLMLRVKQKHSWNNVEDDESSSGFTPTELPPAVVELLTVLQRCKGALQGHHCGLWLQVQQSTRPTTPKYTQRYLNWLETLKVVSDWESETLIFSRGYSISSTPLSRDSDFTETPSLGRWSQRLQERTTTAKGPLNKQDDFVNMCKSPVYFHHELYYITFFVSFNVWHFPVWSEQIYYFL